MAPLALVPRRPLSHLFPQTLEPSQDKSEPVNPKSAPDVQARYWSDDRRGGPAPAERSH